MSDYQANTDDALPLFAMAAASPGLPPRFARWLAFHRAHPQVWALFVQFARQAREAGRPRFGARMIWERIRWYTTVETRTDDYKLNDHYPPYYARLLMLTDEQFDGFFQRRDTNFDVDDATLLQEALQ